MEGLEGDDILIGGLGSDSLVGADGADRFVIQEISDSLLSKPDTIVGFSSEDQIDLQALGLDAQQLQITGSSLRDG